jgi:hypothetical protein
MNGIRLVQDWLPPNALALSRAAPIDRERTWAESEFQNRHDLARRVAASATAPCSAAAEVMFQERL